MIVNQLVHSYKICSKKADKLNRCGNTDKGEGKKENVLVTGINGFPIILLVTAFHNFLLYVLLGMIGSHVAKELVKLDCFRVVGIPSSILFLRR